MTTPDSSKRDSVCEATGGVVRGRGLAGAGWFVRRMCLGVGGVVLLAGLPASAAIVNVAANSASALRTAISNARAGDTLILTGTYNLGSTGITTNADGTALNRIVLMGSGAGATLTGTTANAGLGINHDYWTVQNMNINGFVKSVRIDGANHGVLSNVRATNSAGESFKLRNSSQYWLIENCTSTNAGAEGFYCGDADQNWQGGVVDQTGYVTFYNCTAIAPANDGFDSKEGTHHIKVFACTVDWNNTVPGANDIGNSGIYTRAANLQAINFYVRNNGSVGNAIRAHRDTVGTNTYGSGTEIYNLVASNMGGALLFNSHLDTEMFGYTATGVAGGYLEGSSRTPTVFDPWTFSEMTWAGEGGARYSFPWIPEPSAAGALFPLAAVLLRRRG